MYLRHRSTVTIKKISLPLQIKSLKNLLTAPVIAFFLLLDAASAQPLPLRVGMNYGEARAKLIQQGWQPHIPSGVDMLSCGDRGQCRYEGFGNSEDARKFINMEIGLRKAFRNRGWFETVQCYATGAGDCFHSFTNADGKELVVQTGSGTWGEVPNVIKFYFAK